MMKVQDHNTTPTQCVCYNRPVVVSRIVAYFKWTVSGRAMRNDDDVFRHGRQTLQGAPRGSREKIACISPVLAAPLSTHGFRKALGPSTP